MSVRGLFIFWIFLLITHSANAFGNTTLQQKWEQEKQHQPYQEFNPSLRILQDRHVVFVGGILNEVANLINNYYDDNRKAIEELGGSYTSLKPNSKKSIPENAETEYREILKIYYGFNSENNERPIKPLILIGHSKGGAETLYTILTHPELILDGVIDRVLLIQPAIGGSPLANQEPSWCLRCVSYVLDILPTLHRPNLTTLSTQEAARNFDEAFETYQRFFQKMAQTQGYEAAQKAKEEVSSKIFYVRSKIDPDANPSQIGLGTKIVLSACRNHLDTQEDNDGLLLTTAQMDTRIGTDLGIMISDHVGLTVSLVSTLSREDRKAFTRAAIEQIYECQQ